jgi:hypothetical protein
MVRNFINRLLAPFAYALALYNAGGEGALFGEIAANFRAARRRAAAVPAYVPEVSKRVEFPSGECTVRYAHPSIERGGMHEYIVAAEVGQVLRANIFSENGAAFFNVALIDEAGRAVSYITSGSVVGGYCDIDTRGEYRITVFPGDGYELLIALFDGEQQAAA